VLSILPHAVEAHRARNRWGFCAVPVCRRSDGRAQTRRQRHGGGPRDFRCFGEFTGRHVLCFLNGAVERSGKFPVLPLPFPCPTASTFGYVSLHSLSSWPRSSRPDSGARRNLRPSGAARAKPLWRCSMLLSPFGLDPEPARGRAAEMATGVTRAYRRLVPPCPPVIPRQSPAEVAFGQSTRLPSGAEGGRRVLARGCILRSGA
jgi:hypothetical protein